MAQGHPSLSEKDRRMLIQCYRDGWSVMELARFYNVHHSSVQHYVRGIIQSSEMKKPKYLYTYNEYVKRELERKERKRMTCDHRTERMVVICLDCGCHLEETKREPARVKVIKL